MPQQHGDITLPRTFSQSLYDVLMHQRNLAWRDRLNAMPPGQYVVAVAHSIFMGKEICRN
ncbi:GumN family protein [Salmonella enterica subsp. arizonae]|uniref:GumN family protein n=1 Tax=Salmonella enterica subsp. arizonae TaxID=59203 RepID=A0A379TFD0_SALER|nr:GumN family protein [Salmonella enterica subsp. arizonae]